MKISPLPVLSGLFFPGGHKANQEILEKYEYVYFQLNMFRADYHVQFMFKC